MRSLLCWKFKAKQETKICPNLSKFLTDVAGWLSLRSHKPSAGDPLMEAQGVERENEYCKRFLIPGALQILWFDFLDSSDRSFEVLTGDEAFLNKFSRQNAAFGAEAWCTQRIGVWFVWFVWFSISNSRVSEFDRKGHHENDKDASISGGLLRGCCWGAFTDSDSSTFLLFFFLGNAENIEIWDLFLTGSTSCASDCQELGAAGTWSSRSLSELFEETLET